VVAYDCTDRSTFENISCTIVMMSELMDKKIKGSKILISTKCEVDPGLKKVTEEEARLFQKQ
jgi:hypothetical protein